MNPKPPTMSAGGPDANVCIFVASDYQSTYAPEGESGVGGFTAGSGKILLFVNPSEEDWKKRTPYVVAHEYHHSVWT
jgi:uncharacterized protein YjaZ